MRRFSWILPMILSLLPAAGHALEIPLYSEWSRAPRDARFAEWINTAPPAYVWQNDPEVLASFGLPEGSVTSLCVPSAVGTALLQQKFYQKSARSVQIPGVDAATLSIDTAELLRSFSQRCGSSPRDGTVNEKVYRCLSDIYRISGYARSEIRLISNDPGFAFTIPGYVLEQRVPTLDDVTGALRAGVTVIGIAERIVGGVKKGSHWFNLWGYGRTSGGDVTLFATDSNARYNKSVPENTIDGKRAIFSELATSWIGEGEASIPGRYSRIRLQGLKIDSLPGDVVLGQLIFLKPAK